MQGGPQHGPVMVINQGSKRETGREAQLGNIAAGKAIADIIRTTLGPRSMLKMLLSSDTKGMTMAPSSKSVHSSSIDISGNISLSFADIN